MRFFLALIIITFPALGTVLYQDTTSAGADLPSTGFPLLGTLAPGVYSVTGILYVPGDVDPPYGTDEDTFSVQPAAGNEIISEEIQFTYENSGSSITEPIDGTTDFTGNFDKT